MSKENQWTAGIDWATRSHQACVMSANGEVLDNRSFRHGGVGIRDLTKLVYSVLIRLSER